MKLLTHTHNTIILAAMVLTMVNGCTSSSTGANPGLIDIPVVYAKRTIPVDQDGIPMQTDVRDSLDFSAGGDLYIRSTTSASATERNITRSVTLGIGDVKDVSASFDGKKVIFSLRLTDPAPNDNNIPVPAWSIYEYDVENNVLRKIITQNSEAEKGNDLSPAYLPDGRIVFSSDRQNGSLGVLTLESGIQGGISKNAFSSIGEDRNVVRKSLVLHVMDAQGGNIHQITYNQGNDKDATVMSNGRILFSRYEHKHASNANAVNLYTVNPDGTDLQFYYGDQSASHVDANGVALQFTHPHEMADGRVLVLARPNTGTFAGGDLLAIDGANYISINRPTTANWNNLTAPGQVKASIAQVDNRDVEAGNISVAGRYASAYPLLDGSNRMVVSKGVCRLTTDDVNDLTIVIQEHPCVEPYLSFVNTTTNVTATERPPAYGLWIYDLSNNTERPLFIAEGGYILTDVVVLQPYTRPTIIPDQTVTDSVATASWATENVGVLNIRSVYDRDGVFNCDFSGVTCGGITSLAALSSTVVPADTRPARFLRIVKAVSLPDPDETGMPDLKRAAFGPDRNKGMREVLGYTTIEPDGSVKIKVPANVAFEIQVLDKAGRQIGPRHDNWLQVRPGETFTCNGCHEVPTGTNPPLPMPHGRRDAEAASINAGMLQDGEIPGTQIPTTADVPYEGRYQETMAEVRTRTSSAALDPTANIIFDDYWTSPTCCRSVVNNSSR